MVNITTLDNGLRIVPQNIPALETLYIGIFNSVGNRDEKKRNKWSRAFFRAYGI